MDEDGEPAPSVLDAEHLKGLVLSKASVEAFFGDLGLDTTVIEMRVKGGAAEGVVPTLRAARDAFLRGGASAVQIHYAYKGEDRWDTLMHTRDGIRMARVAR
jgi:hypothetical protein